MQVSKPPVDKKTLHQIVGFDTDWEEHPVLLNQQRIGKIIGNL